MPDSHYNDWANDASVAQSVVHLTRNEKVACSSQVTSSKKVLEPQRLWDFFFFLAWLLIRKAQTKTQTVKLKSVRWFSLIEENRAQEERIPGAAIIENETQILLGYVFMLVGGRGSCG